MAIPTPSHPARALLPALLLASLLIPSTSATAQPESLLHPQPVPEQGTTYHFTHLQTGARQLRGGVFPGDVTLRPLHPSIITKAPESTQRLRLGTVRVPASFRGTKADSLCGAALETPAPTDPANHPIQFWIDLDGDGDLTNHAPVPDEHHAGYATSNKPLAARMERLSTGTLDVGGTGHTYVAGMVKGVDQFLLFIGPSWPGATRPDDFDWTKVIGMLVEVPPVVENPPPGLANPRFGVLRLGDRTSPRRYLTILDLPAPGSHESPRLFVDSNADGVFDEPAISMNKAQPTAKGSPRASEDTKPTTSERWTCTASITLDYAGEKGGTPSHALVDLLMEVRLDPASPPETPTLTYRGEWGRVGLVRIGAREHKALLFDDLASGDYRGSRGAGGNDSGVRLLIDLNDDGKFERGEAFDPATPFEIEGARYRVEGLLASGESFRLVREIRASK